MSKVVKGIKKGFKAIGKGIKKIVKGVGKFFKKVWDSGIGKVILIAAAIFVGGWALGAWGGVGGTTAGAAQVGATSGELLASGAAAGAGGAASGGAVGVYAATEAAIAAGGGAAGAAAGNAALAASLPGGAAVGGGATAATGGTVSGLVPAAANPYAATEAAIAAGGGAAAGGGVAGAAESTVPVVESQAVPFADGSVINPNYEAGSWLQRSGDIVNAVKTMAGNALTAGNGLPAAMAIQGISNAANYREQLRYEEEERDRAYRNLDRSGITLGRVAPSGRPLRRLSTGDPLYGEGGIISRAQRGYG